MSANGNGIFGLRERDQELIEAADLLRGEAKKIDEILGSSSDQPASETIPWPIMAEEAYHGLAGEIVGTIEPHSEADPVAILIHTLIAFGNAVGARPYVRVESTRHYPREFAVVVADTSKGRKGTAWSHPKRILSIAYPEWERDCIKTGLSSGEGLIFEVRDQITKREPIRDGKPRKIIGYEDVIVDPGIADKRRLIVEPEFASTLAQLERKGNILSEIIRQAWDDGTLSPMTKNEPVTATGAHISIIGHITREELVRQLSETEKANGLGNRFLWFLAKRSKFLPEGGALSDGEVVKMANQLAAALREAERIQEMKRDEEARQLWAAIYPTLSSGQPGLTGSLLARAEAHVLRLSMIYALLDRSAFIRVHHLKAAVAVWDYVDASAKHIFGDATGDWVADRICRLLKDGSMTETELMNSFGRNIKADRLQNSLSFLSSINRIRGERIETGGRPATRWSITNYTNKTKKAPQMTP